MAIQDISLHPHEVGIHVYGEPSDVEYFMGCTEAVAIMVAGYDVKNMGDAQHDGHEALRFTLTADGREVGRLVIMTASTEYTFEFDVLFGDEHKRDSWVESYRNPSATSTVVQSIQDFAYEEASLDEAMAGISAKFGVSVTVVDLHGSGGGWPTVKLVGLVPNVTRALVEAWSYSPAYAVSVTEAVTA